MRTASINPVDNKVIKRFKEVSDRTISTYLNNACQEFETWSSTTMPARSSYMLVVADLLKEEKEHLASLITMEMGKPKREAISEIEKCALVCEYYAEHAKDFLAEDTVQSDASHSYVAYEPLGAVLGVMPWNFPFWQAFRFAVPAMMAGNVVLLKHAPNVPQCALAIQDIFRKANLPKYVFQTLIIAEKKVATVLEHPFVKMVSLTGSDAAGSKVASLAGKNLKKSVLELGGNDAFIVLDDANLKKAVEVGVYSRMLNSGQSCIAAKRFIVVEDALEQFTELLVESVKSLKLGDPANDDTDIGPLARRDLANKLIKQIKDSVKKGAEVAIGGNRLAWRSCFVEPTVLTNVRPGMAAFDEELFGPVAAIIAAKDDQEAIELANNSVYGLGGSIWSEDTDKANRLAKRLVCGNVFINGLVKSDPRLPFGGTNRSGYGRELSIQGIREFVNVKTVWIA